MSGYFSLTFDMDDLDVLSEGYGIAQAAPPVIYDRVVPRMLDFLSRQDVLATFFVIAKVCRDGIARRRLQEIADAGHEIANHSLSHEHYLGKSQTATRKDIYESTQLLQDCVGQKIVGFRGPSLTFNRFTTEILRSLEYEYDSSVHPTPLFIGEWIYLTLKSPSRRNWPQPFFIKHALAPKSPHIAYAPVFFKSRHAESTIIEMPISVASPLRIPFYPTFHFMFPLACRLSIKWYLTAAHLVFLAHGLDFIEMKKDRVPAIYEQHPGVGMPWDKKSSYFSDIIRAVRDAGKAIVPLKHQARAISQKQGAV